MPHADPTWAVHGNLYAWNQNNKGAIWEACHAISVFENTFNPANPFQQMNFLMQDPAVPGGNAAIPFGKHNGGTPPYTQQYPSEPVMQIIGTTDDAQQNGSEQIFMPVVGFRSTTKIGVYDPTQKDVPPLCSGTKCLSPGPAAMVAFGPGRGISTNGKVCAEAGHDFNGTTAAQVAAQRIFWNFSFWAASDKAVLVTNPIIPTTMMGGTSYPLSATISGGSGKYTTYQWIATGPGTFSTPNSATTNFTPAVVAGQTPCNITLKVTDNCGRVGFATVAVTLFPATVNPPPTAVDNSAVTNINTPVTFNITNNDFDSNGTIDVTKVDLDPATPGKQTTFTVAGQGTFTVDVLGNVTFTPVTGFTGTSNIGYSVNDNNGASSNIAAIAVTVQHVVFITCPDNVTVGPFSTQAEVNEAFTAWLATASVSGGCNAELKNNNPGAPDVCGGTATVTFTVKSSCGSDVTCTATFTVRGETVVLTCPPASTVAPVVDGRLDPSYQLFKNVSLSAPGNNLYSRGSLYKFEDADNLYLAYVESRGVNDNVYGTVAGDVSYAGWTDKIHSFGNLLGSDKVEIQLFNQSSTKVFDVTFDYLFKQTVSNVVSYNSGLARFATSGASIGNYDGSTTGALGYNNVTMAETSLDNNQSCGVSTYATKSPGQPEQGGWEYRIIYEVAISKAGLGLPAMITDADMIEIPLMHNSPPKSSTAISGIVYCDGDKDGTRDSGEVGLGGWTVNLTGPTNASTTTDATGHYEFFNVAAGLYTLTEVVQPGFTQIEIPASFTLVANQVASDKNFGNWPGGCVQKADNSNVLKSLSEEPAINLTAAPNPFTTLIDIRLSVSVDTKASVEIWDMAGHKIETLFEGNLTADVVNTYRFNGTRYQPAMYMIIVRTTFAIKVERIILLQ